MYRLTAVVVRLFVSSVSAVVDFVTHFPLTDTASIPTLELIRSTRRTLCVGPRFTFDIVLRARCGYKHVRESSILKTVWRN